MKNLFNFIWRYYFFFLFLLLEVFAGILIIQNNYYQQSVYVQSTNEITGSILRSWNNITDYFSLRERNRVLSEENARLRSESVNSFLKTDRNVFIFQDTLYMLQYEYINVKVISNSFKKRNNYLTLNKGRLQGVSKDMAVVSSTGIVGIVKDVSSNFSSVISVLHKDSKISAKIKKNGYVGTVIWDGVDSKRGTLLDIPTHVELKKGDTIITSGYSLIFPEGITIGTVSDFSIKQGDSFYTLNFDFSTNFNNVSSVYVIKNVMKEEQKKLQEKTQHD